MTEIEIRILMTNDKDIDQILEDIRGSVSLAFLEGYDGIEWERQGTFVKVEFCSRKRQGAMLKI